MRGLLASELVSANLAGAHGHRRRGENTMTGNRHLTVVREAPAADLDGWRSGASVGP